MSESWRITPPASSRVSAQKSRLGQSAQGGNFASLLATQNLGMAQNGSPVGRNFVLAGRSPSDLMRMQSFNKAPNASEQGGSSQLQNANSTLELARSMGQIRHIRSLQGSETGFKANVGLPLGDFIRSCPNAKKRSKRAKKDISTTGLGTLSAQFESGKDGIAAIGYDGTGGTSYGKFQIASKVGTMKDFLLYLDGQAPDLASRLRKSGPANTGSRHGAMPDMWRQIASEDPERFEQLQEGFAKESHYLPALQSILQKTGLEESSLSNAMREVIWSTAIQHGPAGASRIFARADAISGNKNDPNYERKMISNVYQIRATQFGSSTESVRAAVQNRFKKEKVLALNMLGGNGTENIA